MVLWEITLGTAYFLGLKRTYRLALKLQRRLISPKHPKIRQFAHRRTRAVFDVAIKFHQKIQERDIEAGRNLGNWILRWLDRMKPSAHIRGHPPAISSGGSSSVNTSKQATNSSSQLKTPGNAHTSRNGESSRHLFTSSRSTWSKPFPSIAMIMGPKPTAGTMTQYRHFCINGPEALLWNYSSAGLNGRLKAFA